MLFQGKGGFPYVPGFIKWPYYCFIGQNNKFTNGSKSFSKNTVSSNLDTLETLSQIPEDSVDEIDVEFDTQMNNREIKLNNMEREDREDDASSTVFSVYGDNLVLRTPLKQRTSVNSISNSNTKIKGRTSITSTTDSVNNNDCENLVTSN